VFSNVVHAPSEIRADAVTGRGGAALDVFRYCRKQCGKIGTNLGGIFTLGGGRARGLKISLRRFGCARTCEPAGQGYKLATRDYLPGGRVWETDFACRSCRGRGHSR
jgi:hypothetical protein